MLAVVIPNAKNLKTPMVNVAAAANKTTLIETCVLISGNEETKSLTLTSMDSKTHQLTLNVLDANVESSGDCIVPASLFNDMIRRCKEGEPVTLSIDDAAEQLIISARGRIQLDLFNQPPEDFPAVRALPPAVTTLAAESLSKAIDHAIALAGKDSYVTFVGEGEHLTLYTNADGRLFSKTVLPVMTPIEEPFAFSASVTLLARKPKTWAGTALFHVHPDLNNFAISVGPEHLFINQILTDTVSYLVDNLAGQDAPDYWVIKSESLMDDISRATVILDKRGLRLERQEESLQAYCQAAGKGFIDTPHPLVDAGGELRSMYLDPKLLERGIKSLECVDLLGEQVCVTIPSVVEGRPDEEVFNLRLTDKDEPGFRTVIVTTVV